jgi:hypothetical protein
VDRIRGHERRYAVALFVILAVIELVDAFSLVQVLRGLPASIAGDAPIVLDGVRWRVRLMLPVTMFLCGISALSGLATARRWRAGGKWRRMTLIGFALYGGAIALLPIMSGESATIATGLIVVGGSALVATAIAATALADRGER